MKTNFEELLLRLFLDWKRGKASWKTASSDPAAAIIRRCCCCWEERPSVDTDDLWLMGLEEVAADCDGCWYSRSLRVKALALPDMSKLETQKPNLKTRTCIQRILEYIFWSWSRWETRSVSYTWRNRGKTCKGTSRSMTQFQSNFSISRLPSPPVIERNT